MLMMTMTDIIDNDDIHDISDVNDNCDNINSCDNTYIWHVPHNCKRIGDTTLYYTCYASFWWFILRLW